MNHYFRAWTGQYDKVDDKPAYIDPFERDVDGLDLKQYHSTGGIKKFWWSGLSLNPPLPLGQDLKPRCYKRIVFGRESFRTGLGGFVSANVLQFALGRIHRQWEPRVLLKS